MKASPSRKKQLAEVYFAKGDFANAQQTVTALQQYPELANYCTLFNILLDLQQQNKSVFDIKDNPAQHQTIISIAADSLHAGYSGARTILTLIDEKQYSEVIRFDTSSTAYRIRKNEVMFANGEKLLRNYPNPFTNSTVIQAQVDDDLPEPKLVIYDIVGQELSITNIHSGLNEVSISAKTLKPGMYFYSIVSNHRRVATEKMICTQ